MALTDSRINEIKNINLIYVFSVDSIFNDKTNKYIGIKIVYGNNQIIETDYTDFKFQDLVKRVINIYNTEKDKRHIVLLGVLTKEIMSDLSFDILKDKEEKQEQIPYFATCDKNINRYMPYVENIIYFIVDKILKYNTFNIRSISGYNHKYMINYEIAGNIESTGMIIYIKNGKLYFEIGIINGLKNNISGIIEEKNGLISTKFNYNEFKGYINYDVMNNYLEKHIDIDKKMYFHDDNPYKLSDEEYKIIDYYLSTFNFDKSSNILKVNDKLFLINTVEKMNESNQLLYKNKNISVFLSKNEIRITEINKEGFSKYEGLVNVELDENVREVIIRKMQIEGSNVILIEENKNNNYNYEIIFKDIDLINSYDMNEREKVKVKTMSDIKKYIRKRAD